MGKEMSCYCNVEFIGRKWISKLLIEIQQYNVIYSTAINYCVTRQYTIDTTQHIIVLPYQYTLILD